MRLRLKTRIGGLPRRPTGSFALRNLSRHYRRRQFSNFAHSILIAALLSVDGRPWQSTYNKCYSARSGPCDYEVTAFALEKLQAAIYLTAGWHRQRRALRASLGNRLRRSAMTGRIARSADSSRPSTSSHLPLGERGHGIKSSAYLLHQMGLERRSCARHVRPDRLRTYS